jgi:Flp pilus assembly protein TadB
MTGPEVDIAKEEGPGRGKLRASHSDREQVVGALQAAFVEGRITKDELGVRVDQVHASRTYAELAEVIADIPTALTGARSSRAPWQATKRAWWFEYAAFLPGIVAIILLPPGPGTTIWTFIVFLAVIYPCFWTLGVVKMAASRRAKPFSEQPLPMPRCQMIEFLRAAQAQGRLTEDELETRTARVSRAPSAWSRAEQHALIADLPADMTARRPSATEAWIGAGASMTAVGVLAVLLMGGIGSSLAFLTAGASAAIVLLVLPITVGLIVDARHQKRAGGQLRLGTRP